MFELIGSLFASFKAKIVIAGFISFVNYAICGDFETLKIIGILIAIDLITGIWKAIKKKNFTSCRLGNTAGKIMLYFFLMIAAHQICRLGLMPGWIDEVVEAYMAGTEFFSIMENAASLGFQPARKIIKKINAKFDEEINNNIKK